jgi:hypothetical protein
MSRIPDPNSLRRDRKDDISWTILDPNGNVETLPTWPLIKPLDRELELWEWIWKRPQSVLWKQNHQEFEVALYIRRLCEVEQRNAAASLHTLLIRQMESLLLTIPSMYKARVKIGLEGAKPDSTKTTRTNNSGNLKRRLKVVP